MTCSTMTCSMMTCSMSFEVSVWAWRGCWDPEAVLLEESLYMKPVFPGARLAVGLNEGSFYSRKGSLIGELFPELSWLG